MRARHDAHLPTPRPRRLAKQGEVDLWDGLNLAILEQETRALASPDEGFASPDVTSADIRRRPWYPRWVDRRPRRVPALVALALLIVACAAACVVYWFVPYEPGRRNQRWTVTVSHGGRTASSTGFGLGRCGDEGDHGATVVKRGALERACYSVGLCPGDSVCDCTSTASVRTRCEEEQAPGPTRLGDRITVPIR